MTSAESFIAFVKDVATVVSATVGVATFVLVFGKLKIEHPGYKLVLEREMKAYDSLDEIDKALSPALTRSSERAFIEHSTLSDIRSRVKLLAADIFTPNELRTPLYALSAYLREAANQCKADDRVELATNLLMAKWRDCKNAARWRVDLLRSQDRPFQLYTQADDGTYDFVDSFRSNGDRLKYINRNPINAPGRAYCFRHSGEMPGLFHRLS